MEARWVYATFSLIVAGGFGYAVLMFVGPRASWEDVTPGPRAYVGNVLARRETTTSLGGNIEGGDVGCHIPGTDYVIIDRTSPGLVLAHEIGHAGDLWHVSGKTNLMNHFTAGDDVDGWQRCIFRRSRFVHYSP